MGSGVISWFSRKQSCVALSTVEAEYVATDEQTTDVLAKPLARVKFEYFREKLGVL